ncbi:MAG: dihydrofolate reductase [Proteobacteria bacterium]|nr:dihydrofolate reductase [Pseudomonadota bacterium]
MSDRKVEIILVAAIGANGVIGTDGQLPWRLKSDLQHFKRVTSGRPVVMGRKTFESIGKPLPNRTNIVMTRDRQFAVAGATLATSLDAALAVARDDARRRGIYEVMIIGGGDVFESTMAMADRLEITHVHASPKGDVVFPAIDPKVWRETARQHYDAGPDDDAGFDTVTYERR